MRKIVLKHQSFNISLLCLLLILSMFTIPEVANSGGGQIVSGPYSLTIRGGGQSDSASLGFDVRADYLKPLYNLHIFGTYDWLDSGSGIGEVESKRYGAGLAVSHTYPGKANAFVGISFINELDEDFWHAYVGGKFKVADNALISGSYGFGIGDEEEIIRNASWLFLADSANWLKLGGVLVGDNGWKANLYYYLTDPGDENISGLEGEISYPITESTSLGVRGSADLIDKSDIDENWQAYLFLTYSLGGQVGTPIDVALDKNTPVEYPRIVRKNKARQQTSVSTLGISPTSTTIVGYTGTDVIFTASGGVSPYSWSNTGYGGSLTVLNATQADWDESYDYCDVTGTATVTVTDSKGASSTAIINIPTEDC